MPEKNLTDTLQWENGSSRFKPNYVFDSFIVGNGNRKRTITRIIDNLKLRKNIVKNARARAQMDFSLSKAQNKLMKIFHIKDGD